MALWLHLFLFAGPAYADSLSSQDKASKVLVLGLATDPKTFNPLLAQETSSTEVLRFLFKGLVEWDPRTGEVKPSLASSWESSQEGLRWIFHLRPDALWSDGEPVTADDVEFTFKVIYDPNVLTSARDIFTLEGQPFKVTKLDKHTVQMDLPVPFAPFLMAMGQTILPRHVLEEPWQQGSFASTWSIKTSPRNIIGTGPFMLHRYVPGQWVELVCNPNYREKSSGGEPLPRIDKVHLIVIPSPEGRLLKFIEGELDAYPLAGSDFPVLRPLAEERGFDLHRVGPGVGTNFVALNQSAKDPVKKSWFTMKAFRRAIAHGIDRQSLSGIIYNSLAEPQCSPLSPSTPIFYNPEVECYEYDPPRARELLSSAGFKDQNGDGYLEDSEGRTVEFVLMTNADNPERVQIAQIIREDLEKLGMKVHLLVLEFNAMVSKLLVSRDWDGVLIGFTGSPDPHFGANVWKKDASLHFWISPEDAAKNPTDLRIDEIFSEASKTLDTERRRALYFEWQRLVAEELPHIYTVLPEVIYAVRKRLEYVTPTVYGGVFHNVEEIDVKSP